MNFSSFLRPQAYPPFALVILNQPITFNYFERLKNSCAYCICADGGFSRVVDYANHHKVNLSSLTPNMIVGDLDSIRGEDLAFASKHGVGINRAPSQDLSDFQKCINALKSCQPAITNVITIGALGGRFDHTAAAISVLHESLELRIFLVSDRSLLFLLPKVRLYWASQVMNNLHVCTLSRERPLLRSIQRSKDQPAESYHLLARSFVARQVLNIISVSLKNSLITHCFPRSPRVVHGQARQHL